MPAHLIYAGFAVYAVIGFLLALAARRHMGEGMSEYFLAGRRLDGILSALSYSATTYSAFMMVGLAGLTYRGGIGALGFELIYFAGLGLVAVFGPRFYLIGKRHDYVTPSQMLGARYQSSAVAAVTALASCIFLIPYSAVQLMGIGFLVEGMTGGEIPFMFGVIGGALLALLWVLVAGLRSVAWTDSLQAVVMMVTALAVVVIVVASLGGLSEFFTRLQTEVPEFLTVPGPGFFDFKVFLGLTLPWFFFSLSNPQVSQRLFAPRGIGGMRTMLLGFLIFGFLYTLISITWGFSALLLFPGLDNPDLATPTLLGSGVVPDLLAIVVMLGIAAAAISTVNSILLTLSSMVSRDIFANMRERVSERQEMIVGRFSIVVLGILALLFASLRLDLISVLSVASSAGLLVTVPALIGTFFWQRGTAAGALSSILVGGLIVLVFTNWGIPPLTGWSPLGFSAGIWGFLVSIVVFVAVSFATKPPQEAARVFVDELRDELADHRVF